MITNSSINFSVPLISSTSFGSDKLSPTASNTTFNVSTPINVAIAGSKSTIQTVTNDVTSINPRNIGSTRFSPVIESNSLQTNIERLNRDEYQVRAALSTVSAMLKKFDQNHTEYAMLNADDKNSTASVMYNMTETNTSKTIEDDDDDDEDEDDDSKDMTNSKNYSNNHGLECMAPTEFYEENNYGHYYRINSTWNNHTQECYEYCYFKTDICLCSPLMKTKSYTDAAAFFSLFFAVVGVVLNSLVLAALKNVVKDDVSCLNIMSLACSDIVKCILYLPVNHVRYSHRDWLMGETDGSMCQFYAFIANMQGIRSVLNILLITTSKWWIMFFPPNKTDTRKKHYLIAIACVWIAPAIFLLPTLVSSWGQFGLECSSRGCTIIDDKEARNPKNVLNGVGMVLPIVILVVADVSIIWKVRELSADVNRASQAISMKDSSIEDMEDVTDNEYDAAVKGGLLDILRRQEKESIKMMVLIFLGFIGCFLPTVLLSALDSQDKQHPNLTIMAKLAFWATPIVNPIIYIYARTRYRSAMIKLLSKFKVLNCCTMIGSSRKPEQLAWN